MRDAASEVYGLGERAMARRSDPATSHDAAASISEEGLTRSQCLVVEALSLRGPMDDNGIRYVVHHIMHEHSFGDSRLRSARAELCDRPGHPNPHPLVRDSGRRERTPSGRWAAIWCLVENRK